MQRPAWRRAVMVAAGVHLAIAAFFSTHWPTERLLPPVLERPLSLYGKYSGAETHFNFFAPNVSTQARAYFVLTRRDGSSWTERLDAGGVEANQRLAMMFTYYGVPETRAVFARSWAVYMLEHHPEAVAVEVHVEILEIPTLDELRLKNAAARWVDVDRLRLRRDEIS